MSHDQLSKIAQGLPRGHVIILHSPQDSTMWNLYGDAFPLRARYESDYMLYCRCVGARQYGGRIRVIYKNNEGGVCITKHKKWEDAMAGAGNTGAKQVEDFFRKVEGKKPFEKELQMTHPGKDEEYVSGWEQDLIEMDQKNE